MDSNQRSIHVSGARAEGLRRLFGAALDEAISAILDRLTKEGKPQRVGWPEMSMMDNGMPSISDRPPFGGNGPLKYSTVLEPTWNDRQGRAQGKFPPTEFPAMARLVSFVSGDPEIARAYMDDPHDDLLGVFVSLAVESAADMHFLRFGETPSTDRTRALVLRGVLNGLTAERLDLALVIPIAMARFDFDRFRLAEDAILVRMSAGLQRARWSGKSWGMSGHGSVMAAATHALVLTNLGMPNTSKILLFQQLSRPDPALDEIVDGFFAALRLVLGIRTGYAQQLRLARGWSIHDSLGDPQVFAIGARKYPTAFDDFGWTAPELPLVDRSSIAQVAQAWKALRGSGSKKLALATRRLNASMTRDDPADALLDATIALEVLLGDDDGQSIAWKLRMRAAALVGVDWDRAEMKRMRIAVKETYAARSFIVHGSGKMPKTFNEDVAARTAIDTLRTIIGCLVAHPEYMDPLRIDEELLLRFSSADDSP